MNRRKKIIQKSVRPEEKLDEHAERMLCNEPKRNFAASKIFKADEHFVKGRIPGI